ncbi:hypothetical protein D3C85_1661080 [compost metagenome]
MTGLLGRIDDEWEFAASAVLRMSVEECEMSRQYRSGHVATARRRWSVSNLDLLSDFLLVDIKRIGNGNEDLSKELPDSLFACPVS